MAACGGGATEAPSDAGVTSDGALPDAAPDPRQAEREASLFRNLSFEDVDASGIPAAWACICYDETYKITSQVCQTTTTDPKHGQRALLLAPGCSAYQDTTKLDPTKGVRYDFFEQGAVFYPESATLYPIAGSSVSTDTGFVDGLADAQSVWRSVSSVGLTPTAGIDDLSLYLSNSTKTTMLIDDIVAIQDAPNPGPKTASILVADHFETMTYAAGTDAASVYTPLPLDYASQTPLYVELTVTPSSVVDHIEYVADQENNWGAIVHFVAGASSDNVSLAWKSVALTRSITDAERPTVYAANGDPSQWLPASAIAESDYAPIAMNAQALAAASASPLDKMLATIGFTSTYVTNLTNLVSLDATAVWNTKDASCTGYTNLASATGRALGVPTRHIVNVMVGMSQQMHSINEFYLGADLGWRRVEPQSTTATVDEDYGFIMRLVLPSDEVAAALDNSSSFTGDGVPLHELTAPVTGAARLTPSSNTHFADCDDCLNRASKLGAIRDDAGTVKATFDKARTAWQVDRAQFIAGTTDPARLAARRKLLDARTLADVNAVIDAL